MTLAGPAIVLCDLGWSYHYGMGTLSGHMPWQSEWGVEMMR